MGGEPRQNAYLTLVELAECQGYVTFDDVMNCSDRFELSLQDFDWLSSSITTHGIIVYADNPIQNLQISDEEYDDFAQSDYEKVYNRITELEPSLKPFVDGIRTIIPPQRHEIRQLKYQSSEGNSFARSRMIEMYLRIALRIALQRAENYDMDIVDAVSYACIGLITAVDKYAPDTSGPFASYAGMWIFQNITRDQPNRRPLVYYPAHIRERYISIYPFLKQYGCIDCNRMYSCSEILELIMERLECDERTALLVIEQAIVIEYIEDSPKLSAGNDSKSGYTDLLGRTLAELSKDTVMSEDTAFEDVYRGITHESLEKLLEILKPREREVICKRYGWSDDEIKTLEEIGISLNITRERVRQIEAKALRKLQHHAKQMHLGEF